mmetsp:Transcript_23091/g.27804  ORF Transcript_23091/g.27804 Transcript_23091/m.27804 type:complete len:228 (-) Transcript_23091:144-827(-)
MATEGNKHTIDDYKKPEPFWMKTKAFKRLCSWAFKASDRNSTGEVNKDELYAGMLFVHLNLAKYAGPAACYPPTRDVVDELFEASDDNNSGGIDEEEFRVIMVILCSQLTFRIAAYYIILITIVPYIIWTILKILDVIGVDEAIQSLDENVWESYAPSFLQTLVNMIPDTTWESLPETLVSTILFYVAIPVAFNTIDKYSEKFALETNVESTTTTTTTATSDEKKDD